MTCQQGNTFPFSVQLTSLKFEIPSGIYAIRNVVNGKVYVGSAVNLRIRWKNHRNGLIKQTHHNRHLQGAFNKYGESNLQFIVLEFVSDVNSLVNREQVHIDSHQAANKKYGYNLAPTAGNCLGVKMPPEAIAKTAAAHRGMKRSAETRALISAAGKGKKIPQHVIDAVVRAHKGKKMSPEAIAKSANSRRGKKLSPEHRAKITANNLGRKASPETRAKLSAVRTGVKQSPETIAKRAEKIRGVPKTPEHRANLSAARKAMYAKKRAEAQANSEQVQLDLFE